ncbi:hypothetical protein Tdes44962_MAKER09921 [Teratosphaeria destructans]|uniref:Uncharacterized protein n=1 Tax=Teratosphaeria destructans TaxID=418781 RepID=A0A9W7SQV9_9PEZI|nr:hypothetical protein Tdes44962_MAKER09921 [Teratosphaeria destructans]
MDPYLLTPKHSAPSPAHELQSPGRRQRQMTPDVSHQLDGQDGKRIEALCDGLDDEVELGAGERGDDLLQPAQW